MIEDIAPACTPVAASARPAVAGTGSLFFAGAVAPSTYVPSTHVRSTVGAGSTKQERKQLAMTRNVIDGWPPGPQNRKSG